MTTEIRRKGFLSPRPVHEKCGNPLHEIWEKDYLVGYECKQCNVHWNIILKKGDPTGLEENPDGVYTTINKMLNAGM